MKILTCKTCRHHPRAHLERVGSLNVCGENDAVPPARTYVEPMIIHRLNIGTIQFCDGEVVLIDLDLEFGKTANIDDAKMVGLIFYQFKLLSANRGIFAPSIRKRIAIPNIHSVYQCPVWLLKYLKKIKK